MRNIKSLISIINVQTIGLTILAVISTYLCIQYKLFADFPLTLIATAVIFPIVFSINGAYKRREVALREYGSIKAHGRAIFFAARDWVPKQNNTAQEEIKGLLGDTLIACRELLMTPLEQMNPAEEKVYGQFSKLSRFIEKLRDSGVSGSEISRTNQYLSKMIIAFENVKHIYEYRTPRTLRTYSRVFIYALPILYGPYFAEISKGYATGLEYFMPVLFTMILVGLDNIQEQLENPFDQIGEDDVVINAEKFVRRLDL